MYNFVIFHEYILFFVYIIIYIIIDGWKNKSNYTYYKHKNRKDESDKMSE